MILRAPRAEDAPAIFEAFASDPEVTRFLRWRPHRTLADAQRAMASRLRDLETGEELSWLLSLRGDGSVLGIISVWPGEGEAEIGFALGRRSWGQGLATEAIRSVVAWAFEPDSIARVWATCDVENLASARVLEKAGLQREGLLEAHAVHPNLGPDLRDCLLYSRVRQVSRAR
jgi:RimJ/RimL family protein N-acetyltransferase